MSRHVCVVVSGLMHPARKAHGNSFPAASIDLAIARDTGVSSFMCHGTLPA